MRARCAGSPAGCPILDLRFNHIRDADPQLADVEPLAEWNDNPASGVVEHLEEAASFNKSEQILRALAFLVVALLIAGVLFFIFVR